VVYWAGPLLGAVLAGLLWKLVLLPRDPTDL
jgi:glycerol uptake facilitator-like aquaporin